MDFITPKEASQIFDPPCTVQNIYYLISQGKLTPIRTSPYLLTKKEVIAISKENLNKGKKRKIENEKESF